jgi:hypothetical protein
VLSNGVGGYSPLQSYLLFKQRLRRFQPEALLINVYTGNDFNDILRVDDRPHFVPKGDGYEIGPPIWYRYHDPEVRRHSRVMFVMRSLLDRVGLRNLYLRLLFLGAAAGQEEESWLTILDYMNDVRKSSEPTVGYSGALSAQFLNQQLFLHHFPSSEAEAMRRMRFLLRMIRSENPDLLLIMSPIPSYELVGEQPVDAALRRALERLPLTYGGGIEEEGRLYYALRDLAAQEGWLFVDNLAGLQAYGGSERLYNDYDYHVTEAASVIIGATQAEAIKHSLRGDR